MISLVPNGNGHVTLVLPETLDAQQGHAFRQAIRDALTRSPQEMTLDCGKLTYVDSTGLGLLSLANTEAKRLGCKVVLSNLSNGHVRKVLELMQFDRLFTIEGASSDGKVA